MALALSVLLTSADFHHFVWCLFTLWWVPLGGVLTKSDFGRVLQCGSGIPFKGVTPSVAHTCTHSCRSNCDTPQPQLERTHAHTCTHSCRSNCDTPQPQLEHTHAHTVAVATVTPPATIEAFLLATAPICQHSLILFAKGHLSLFQ